MLQYFWLGMCEYLRCYAFSCFSDFYVLNRFYFAKALVLEEICLETEFYHFVQKNCSP